MLIAALPIAALPIAAFLAGLALGVYIASRLASRHTALLRWQAQRDPLTGLRNRHALAELVKSIPPGEQAAVLLLDLDHFGDINSDHGHAGGDQALRDFANRLHLAAGGAGMAFRLGGDEFLLVIPYFRNLTITQAMAAAQDTARSVLRMVTGPCTMPDGRTVDIGTTIGVSSGDPRQMPELMHAADTALYEAKAAGRGRVAYNGPVVVQTERPTTRLRDFPRGPRHAYEPPIYDQPRQEAG